MTDPIADMLTRIRNAQMRHHEIVEVLASNINLAIAKILVEEGFVQGFDQIDYKNQGKLLIRLKYNDRDPVIRGLRRVSKPGRRQYLGYHDIKPFLHGTGISVLSTPKGVMTDRSAQENKVGGEVLLYVW